MSVLQFLHPVVAKTRRTPPDGNIAVLESELVHRIVASQPAKLERRRQTQRHGDDWMGEIALVFVLVERQARTRLVAVDQACIGAELGIAGHRRRGPARLRKQSGMGGQGLPVSGSMRS